MNFQLHFETVPIWLESVATTLVAALGRLNSQRAIKIVEGEDHTLLVESGEGKPGRKLRIIDGHVAGPLPQELAATLRKSRLQLILLPQPFLFRPLELPRRAAEYLGGIVRAQIDRLTPWSADAAVFGWSAPADLGTDRIAVTVAATARSKIDYYLQALGEVGAQSIAIFTTSPDAAAGAAPINVFEQEGSRRLGVRHVHRALAAVLLGAVVLAAAAAGADIILGGNLDAKRQELARKIIERRAAIRAGELGADSAVSAERILERRKHSSPSPVLVLEALSHILPDNTYVTELRIEADKLRLTGITQDAPSLIRLLEESPQFTRATFFAPTTRAPSDPGERFHIEAHLEPIVVPRS